MKHPFLFSSDNSSAVDPRVLQAVVNLGRDHCWAYGDDDATRAGTRAIKKLFDSDCDVYFVYNGTGANVVSLSAATRSHESVVCTEMAHINEDECGAPEAFGGFKLHGVPSPDGKLRPEDIVPFLRARGFEHTNQPRSVSITQATEIGTVYAPAEVQALGTFTQANGLILHMDGARIANAAAAVARDRADGVSETSATAALREMTVGAGVDILSFGATKNGLMFGEAIVVFRRELAEQMAYIRKQATQLHSKMRYIAAQFDAWVREGAWYENAAAANAKARILGSRLESIPGVRLHRPVEGNGVFVHLPERVIEPLRSEFGFYLWNPDENLVRLMVSYDTDETFIEAFLERTDSLART